MILPTHLARKLAKLGVLCLVSLASLGAVNAAPGVTFRDFTGAVYTPAPQITRELGIGWVRLPVYWHQVEPKQGEWNWKGSDAAIAAARAQGLQTVILLAYSAPWAASIPGKIFSPPKHIQDWQDYVSHVVSRYSAPAFGIHYFQIWNEPTRQAGFWTGTDQEFVDQIYLPAATIIRRSGCFVVFGGWPDGNSIEEYDRLLRYHGAWRRTDFLDLHYRALDAWQALYNEWIKTGKCRGIWETEVGFRSDPDFIPMRYLTILDFSLRSGWNDPAQYKLFWFACWGSGADGPKCLSVTNPKGTLQLTSMGTRLAVLSQVFGAGPLTPYTGYSISESRTPAPSFSAGFSAGTRRVVTLLFNHPPAPGGGSVTVSFPMRSKPQAVQVISSDGVHLRATSNFRNNMMTVTAVRGGPTGAPSPGDSTGIYFLVDSGAVSASQ